MYLEKNLQMTKSRQQHRLENPKETIINKTKDLIQMKSYNSVTFDNIANELSIKKPSIIYHFKSKDELGLEVIKTYRKQIQDEIAILNKYSEDPIVKLKNYFRFFANVHRKSKGMCPAGVMSAEFNSLTLEIQTELKGFFKENLDWLIDVLEEGKSKDLIKFPGNAKERAFLIEGAIEGGLLFSRMEQNSEILWNIMKQLKLSLEITEEWTITPKDKSGNQIII